MCTGCRGGYPGGLGSLEDWFTGGMPNLLRLWYAARLLVGMSLIMCVSSSLSKTRAHKVGRIISAIITGSTVLTSASPEVLAFENAVPNSYTMPKSKGPAPRDLGLNSFGKLRECLKPSPNCFSTTTFNGGEEDLEEERGEQVGADMWGVDHTIPLWEFEGTDPNEGFLKLKRAIEKYEPGHDGIDGGGFSIIKLDPVRRYIYVQFESLKRGYIDDVEFVVNPDCKVQVVSSSRLGYLDYRVNAKRLNYIRSKLVNSGFKIEEISFKTHPVYFDSNQDISEIRESRQGSSSTEKILGSKKY